MNPEMIDANTTIWSIGHSSQPLAKFLGLLRTHQIATVVDVRSQPSSKYSPQFNSAPLREACIDHGVEYVFAGTELGGRPRGSKYYDADGRVLYGLVAQSPEFLQGIDQLLAIAAVEGRTAIMCAEENPTDCHRRLLIGRVLRDRGVPLKHIRGNGIVEDESLVEKRSRSGASLQPSLFGEHEVTTWKSIRSVLQRGQQPTSLGH